MRKELLTVAIRAALCAGKDILDVYNDPSSDFGVERKADNSPLTLADKRSHERIMSYLKDTPYPVLSEEGRDIPYEERKEWHTLWIVDPLDGTKEFIKKNGEFTVNIALVVQGKPVLGVIYIPVTEELYVGEEQLGAFKFAVAPGGTGILDFDDAHRLPSGTPQGRPFTIVASRSHLSPETEAYIAEAEATHGKACLISCGSSIKICRVAEGAADLYPRFAPTMEWDTAAGHAITKAAGKEVYHTDGKTPLHYNKEDLLNPWFIVR